MNVGNMTYPGYYVYPASNTLVAILALLLKVFAFVLFIAVVVGIVMWIRNAYYQTENVQNAELKADRVFRGTPMLKVAAIIGAGILGIILIWAFISGSGWSGMSYSYGINSVYVITSILMFIIKALVVFLVISLIMAVVLMVKEQIDKGKLNTIEENKKI